MVPTAITCRTESQIFSNSHARSLGIFRQYFVHRTRTTSKIHVVFSGYAMHVYILIIIKKRINRKLSKQLVYRYHYQSAEE